MLSTLRWAETPKSCPEGQRGNAEMTSQQEEQLLLRQAPRGEGYWPVGNQDKVDPELAPTQVTSVKTPCAQGS